MTALTRRVHRLGAGTSTEELPGQKRDHLEAGTAFARAYLMRDGTVVVEGKRGAVTLEGPLADEVQHAFRLAGVRER